MADVVEQALLLPEDMADLRSIRKHEMFLSLERDLTPVSSVIAPFPHLFFFFFLIIIFVFPNLCISSSSKGCSIRTQGQGNNEQLS